MRSQAALVESSSFLARTRSNAYQRRFLLALVSMQNAATTLSTDVVLRRYTAEIVVASDIMRAFWTLYGIVAVHASTAIASASSGV
jgi:hypothetical protein